MNPHTLISKYEGKSFYKLLVELDQHKTARERAETDAAYYREAFAWLETRPWFQDHRHELSEWWELSTSD